MNDSFSHSFGGRECGREVKRAGWVILCPEGGKKEREHSLLTGSFVNSVTYIPFLPPVSCLRYIMDALPMTAHVEHFVVYTFAGCVVETLDFALETLPLCAAFSWDIGLVGSVDETEIRGSLRQRCVRKLETVEVETWWVST